MSARHNQPRAALGGKDEAISGITPGSVHHRLLLALRGVGGMTSDQVYARFNSSPSAALHRLKAAGLVEMPPNGQKGKPISLTSAGRELISPTGPLCRRKTLISYCQL